MTRALTRTLTRALTRALTRTNTRRRAGRAHTTFDRKENAMPRSTPPFIVPLMAAASLPCVHAIATAAATAAAVDDVNDVVWIGEPGVGGIKAWNVADHWLKGVVPGPTDRAIFNGQSGSITTVTGEDPVIVGRLQFVRGTWTLNIRSDSGLLTTWRSTIEPTMELGVEADTSVEIRGNLTDGEAPFLGDSVVGGDAPALLLVRPPLNFGTLEVGRRAQGRVTMLGGVDPTLSAEALIVGATGPGTHQFLPGSADIVVNGRTDIGRDAIGQYGVGTFTGQSRLTSGTLALGGTTSAIGIARFSELEVGGSVDVGLAGRGSMHLDGTATIGGTLGLGLIATENQFKMPIIWGDGQITMEPDTTLDVGGDLWLGLAGDARLDLGRGALVTVAGSVDTLGFAGETDRTVVYRLGAPAGLPTATLLVEGEARLPTVQVRFDQIDGLTYTPAAGDEWILAAAGGSLTVEHLSLPLLSGAIAWDVENIDGRLTARIEEVQQIIAADVNQDGAVDLIDVLTVLANFGLCEGACPADVNGDGIVDFSDVLNVLSEWAP
ncbi:MAG: hypothetical protein AB8G96_08035 [Phycisphaerales bacterium]